MKHWQELNEQGKVVAVRREDEDIYSSAKGLEVCGGPLCAEVPCVWWSPVCGGVCVVVPCVWWSPVCGGPLCVVVPCVCGGPLCVEWSPVCGVVPCVWWSPVCVTQTAVLVTLHLVGGIRE